MPSPTPRQCQVKTDLDSGKEKLYGKCYSSDKGSGDSVRGKRVKAIGKCSTLEISQALQLQAEKELFFYKEESREGGRVRCWGWNELVDWCRQMEEYSSQRSAACQEGCLGEFSSSSAAQGWGSRKERRGWVQSYLNHMEKDDLPVNCKVRWDFQTISARWEHGAHGNFTTPSNQVVMGAGAPNSFSFFSYIGSSVFSTTRLL